MPPREPLVGRGPRLKRQINRATGPFFLLGAFKKLVNGTANGESVVQD